jgi:hypothetical protein
MTLALRLTKDGKAVYKDWLKVGPDFCERGFERPPSKLITLMRQFKREELQWITIKPPIGDKWSACLPRTDA